MFRGTAEARSVTSLKRRLAAALQRLTHRPGHGASACQSIRGNRGDSLGYFGLHALRLDEMIQAVADALELALLDQFVPDGLGEPLGVGRADGLDL